MALAGWNKKSSPYHPGEQALHERVGRRDQQERSGRRVHRPYMPDQHRAFFASLPFMIVGSVDADGWPWASILFGRPGFVSTPDDTTLLIGARPIPGDPLAGALAKGAPLGFVGIELPTRRRNRVNGVVRSVGNDDFTVDVVQSYGNCPQYIHTRGMTFTADPTMLEPAATERLSSLDQRATAVIRKADTFFVASHNDRDDKRDTGGADVNHRGGKPGFIKVEGDTLTIPDYAGNFAFNTLGNFLINPKGGLLFIDFATGDLWQFTGTTELILDRTDEIAGFDGAERAWRFHVDHGVRLKTASPLAWESGEPSPVSLRTGDWEVATRR